MRATSFPWNPLLCVRSLFSNQPPVAARLSARPGLNSLWSGNDDCPQGLRVRRSTLLPSTATTTTTRSIGLGNQVRPISIRAPDRLVVWSFVAGVLAREGLQPDRPDAKQSLVRLDESPSSRPSSPPPFCRDRWHRTHALARSQPLLPVSLPPSKVLPRRRPRERSRRCSYPAPGNRARNQADSAADGASQRFAHRRRRLLQLVLRQTAPIRRRLVPKILPPPPPPPPPSALLSRISNPPSPRRPHGVALTNRRWPRPYRDCRVISPLLLFGLLGSALIWKIVAFWSAGGGCATWTSSTRRRRRGGWSVPHAPTPTSPHPCSLPSPPSSSFLQGAHIHLHPLDHIGVPLRVVSVGHCWGRAGPRTTAGRLSRLIDEFAGLSHFFFIRPRPADIFLQIALYLSHQLWSASLSAPLPSGPTMGDLCPTHPGPERRIHDLSRRRTAAAACSGLRTQGKRTCRPSKHGHGRLSVSARRLHQQSFHARASRLPSPKKGCSCSRPRTVMDVPSMIRNTCVHSFPFRAPLLGAWM